jgi:hypothetical protein
MTGQCRLNFPGTPGLKHTGHHDQCRNESFDVMVTGSPPRFVYEIEPRTATAVGTAEETPGSTRRRF